MQLNYGKIIFTSISVSILLKLVFKVLQHLPLLQVILPTPLFRQQQGMLDVEEQGLVVKTVIGLPHRRGHRI